ncbi:MAG TPA: hypothetical protein VJM49_00525 [Acidimicrobiales bacterium]|nr:hypothetical protein [Acidimicrobiales bacterium]
MAVNMHVRDIPDEVKQKLADLAAREHMSLNAYVVRQLEVVARTADNARLLDALPSDAELRPEDVVAALDLGREGR